MEGNNELRLNHATMARIVQEWAEREFASKPEITDVSYDAANSTFRVRVQNLDVPDCDAPHQRT
jgi:hypothetical protein